MAYRDKALETGRSALLGAMSGAGMSGGMAIVNEVYNAHQDRKIKKETVDFIEKRKEREAKGAEGVQYAFVGTTADGIEVYETSEAVKKLPYKERRKEFKRVMEEEYRGRTAKFTKNGKTFYARFDSGDVNKNIYGDKKSDGAGHDAKINVGADGNIFELVENATFKGEQKEKGKPSKAHKETSNWMYFVKKIQIDNKVFDVVANVRETTSGEFVYDIQLNENNETPASPHAPAYNRQGRNGYAQSGAPTGVSETGTLNTEYPSPGVDRNNEPLSADSIPQTAGQSQENTAGNIFGSNVLPTAKEAQEQRRREARAAKAKTEVERTGILLGVKDDVIQVAKRVSKALGIDVVFYKSTGKDKGYYNHNDGKIYLNANTKDPIATILGHEMIHDIQRTAGYMKFFSAVIKDIQKSGMSLDQRRAELQARYKAAGVELKNIAKIDQDVVAEYAQEHLFTNEASIVSVVNADAESGHKIVWFLDNVLAKLGNESARERAFVQNARALYAKALRETAGRKGQQNWQETVETESERMRTGSQTEAASAKTETSSETTSEKHPIIRENVLPTAAERFGNKTAETQEGKSPQSAEPTAPSGREHVTEDTQTGWDEDAYDGLTEEEYDEKMDTLDAEASMAGHSMLYEDGRQFAIGKEKGVAKQDEKRYNDLDNKLKGESYADTGGYDGVRTTQLRENEKAGIYGRGNQEDVTGDSKYTKGRQRESLPSNERENDGDAPKRGVVQNVFHGTLNQFKTFIKSYVDIGIHFGTMAQAEARLSGDEGYINKFDLRIDNPLITKDIFGERTAEKYAEALVKESEMSEDEKRVFQREITSYFNSDTERIALDSLEKKLLEGKHTFNIEIREEGIYVALALVDDDSKINAIPMTEFIDKNMLVEILGFKDTAETLKSGSLSEAAMETMTPYIYDAVLPFEVQFLKLRKIEDVLQSFGYDGFAYKNDNEGKGWSYAVFDDSRIIRKGGRADDEGEGRQYAIAKDAGGETENAEGTIFDGLPRKAQAELTRTERYLSERIGEILGVPKQGQRAFLKSMIRDISEGYMKNGRIGRVEADGIRISEQTLDEAWKELKNPIECLPTAKHSMGFFLKLFFCNFNRFIDCLLN